MSCPKSAINKDVLQLLVDDTNVGDEILLDPYLDGIVPVSLPASVRSEGPHAINYKVIYRSGGLGRISVHQDSSSLPITRHPAGPCPHCF